MSVGALYLLSCLAEFGDSRHSMLLAGIVPALLRLAECTRDNHTWAGATSLLRLLTNSTDRRSTEGIHGGGLNVAGSLAPQILGLAGTRLVLVGTALRGMPAAPSRAFSSCRVLQHVHGRFLQCLMVE